MFPFPKEFECSVLWKNICCPGVHLEGLAQDPDLESVLFSNMITEITHGDTCTLTFTKCVELDLKPRSSDSKLKSFPILPHYLKINY